ncbi:probable WRKY transcription factor 7 [Solanum stenotomum]|uniref:probable WRKY transcription factor 7 n=1 Tax=Solanum stenotomum TaxID=172797 RepID=UPI0020D077AF|nr:probable WRKY transcription factor 7 [Solanum stenotomum]
MAVELMMNYINTPSNTNNSFTRNLEEKAVIQEAASGVESVEKLIKLLSQKQKQGNFTCFLNEEKSSPMEIEIVADAAVTKFKKVISLLGGSRTGYARFRRAPIASPLPTDHFKKDYADSKVYCPTSIQQLPPIAYDNKVEKQESVTNTINFSYAPEICRSNSFNISTITGETERKYISSVVEPPLSSSFKIRKCTSSENGLSGMCSGSSGRCHCSKRRKLRLKRVVRVPAISMKLSDIPPDDYSWRKYGQKPIKGSPHPRAYYKCSSVRGCPARKHVERALDEPTMLMVTYEGEHNHSLSIAETSCVILESDQFVGNIIVN